MCGRGPLVLKGPPEAILAILRSAQSGTPDPRLGEVLEAFRSRWLAIARKRYRGMEDDVEDAVQAALLKLVSGEKLDRLSSTISAAPTAIEARCRSGHSVRAIPHTACATIATATSLSPCRTPVPTRPVSAVDP